MILIKTNKNSKTKDARIAYGFGAYHLSRLSYTRMSLGSDHATFIRKCYAIKYSYWQISKKISKEMAHIM